MIDFYFKGISGQTMGVLLSDHWTPAKAGRNVEKTEIEGYDGAIYEDLNALPVEREVLATLMPYANLERVAAWLTGSGKFARNGRYTNARIDDQIDFDHVVLKYKSLEIPFVFEPYWYSEDDFETVTDTVINYGNVPSVPVIRITGTGICAVNIGDVGFSVDLGSTEQAIVIDCKEKEEDKPHLIHIGWEYPVLVPGENEVDINTTGTAKVEMMRRSRWNVG